MSKRISLLKPLYEKDPYNEFSKIHNVDRQFWVRMFHTGYMWRNYSISELKEYALIYKLDVSTKTLQRWIKRTEDYIKAQKARQQGITTVTEEFFDKELT
jgi:hypothetical protein